MDLLIDQRLLYYKFFLAILSVYGVYANQSSYKWTESLPDPWTLSNEQLDLYLPRFYKMHPDYHDRLIALNLWRVGTPYGIFCLGEEQGVDPDPIIRFDTSDCTVHVLTTIALAESNSFQRTIIPTLLDVCENGDQLYDLDPKFPLHFLYVSFAFAL